MKQILLTAAAFSLAAGAVFAAPDAKKPEAKQAKQMCAVMKHEITKIDKDTAKSVYNGKTYYFCCAGCKPEFEKNPAKYASAQSKPAKAAKKG